jgi:polyhydroxyalkanoate synthase
VVKFREMQMGKGGMKGQDMASTFSFLRPNDLVWNYVVGNYLKGETPPPFDLLYWNSDSTNLPGPSTPGTCATPTCKTTSSSPAS